MTPFLTRPFRPVDRSRQIAEAARTIASLPASRTGTKKPAKERVDPVIARHRLKTPWLTVYTVEHVEPGAWTEITRAVVRFYFNRPASKLLFAKSIREQTLYLTIDPDRNELALSAHKGGQPMTIQPDSTSYSTQPFIAKHLLRLGYLREGESTYFPLRRVPYGLVADLSVAYSKADAIAREEDECAANAARPSRPAS